MTEFIAVNYHNKSYPSGVKCEIEEIAGHLDKESVNKTGRYSLHTEYSYSKRKLNNRTLDRYPALKESVRNIPRLWFNKEWSKQFADFIIDIVGDSSEPEVIEIHPPFKDYCRSFEELFDVYSIFEDTILSKFPSTIITMENRTGSMYPRYGFIMSSVEDMAECGKGIIDCGLKLNLAADYPQMFTAERYDYGDISINEFVEKHRCLEECKKTISSIHLWGKKQNKNGRWIAHAAGLDAILPNEKLDTFMTMLSTFYDDGRPRYLVPEVNASEEYVQEIARHCMEYGIKFV